MVMFRFVLAIALILSPASAAAEQPAVSSRALPRFHQLDQGLYRGGQPKDGGFQSLRQMGIRTVINLREDNPERQVVESLGMKSIHIPLSAAKGVPDPAIRQFFDILRDPSNYPIFFHCRRGADRTGAMAGFYRIEFQGWDGKKAYQEARDIGMRWWYRNLKGQIEKFDPSRF